MLKYNFLLLLLSIFLSPLSAQQSTTHNTLGANHIIKLTSAEDKDNVVYEVEYQYAQNARTIYELIHDTDTDENAPIPLPNITSDQIQQWLIPALKAIMLGHLDDFTATVIKKLDFLELKKLIWIAHYLDINELTTLLIKYYLATHFAGAHTFESVTEETARLRQLPVIFEKRIIHFLLTKNKLSYSTIINKEARQSSELCRVWIVILLSKGKTLSQLDGYDKYSKEINAAFSELSETAKAWLLSRSISLALQKKAEINNKKSVNKNISEIVGNFPSYFTNKDEDLPFEFDNPEGALFKAIVTKNVQYIEDALEDNTADLKYKVIDGQSCSTLIEILRKNFHFNKENYNDQDVATREIIALFDEQILPTIEETLFNAINARNVIEVKALLKDGSADIYEEVVDEKSCYNLIEELKHKAQDENFEDFVALEIIAHFDEYDDDLDNTSK